MKKGILASFMVALMLVTILSAVVTANAITLSKEKDEDITCYFTAFVFGRIKNLKFYPAWKSFEAVNIRIITFLPFKFYQFKSGEEIIIPSGYLGIVTSEFICAFTPTPELPEFICAFTQVHITV